MLYGFLLLVTGRHAISQLVGFLVIDNGIADGGVPVLRRRAARRRARCLLDVLLVVLILYVLTGRIRDEFGGADLDDLTELHD